MYSSYILKGDEGLISFYTQNNILYKRVYRNKKWSVAQVIQTGVKPLFALNTIDSDNRVMIFTHSIKNQIFFTFSKDDGEFVSRPILESHNLSSNPYFFCIFEKDIFTIFYAYQIEKNKYNIAKMQLINGSWSESETIDISYSATGTPFIAQKVSDNHYVIFYESYQNTLNMCYREVSTNQVSDAVIYHNTSYNLIDKSFLISNTSIYTAFIMKSMFSYQLLFRQKTKYGYKNIKVIAEGQRLKNLSIFIYDECVYVVYTLGEDIYYVYGEERDDIDFSKPQKLSSRLPHNNSPKKACVICGERKHNQLLVLESAPFQPIVVTDINPFFQDNPFRAIKKDKDENYVVEEKEVKLKESPKQEILESREKLNYLNQINKLKTELYIKMKDIERLEKLLEKQGGYIEEPQMED